MLPIAVITDSDASIPADIAAQYDIRQVPISVQFGAQTFESGVNISDQELFERVDRDGRLPTTAAPTAGKYVEAFEAAFGSGAQAVLCFCVSSKVSASYQAAITARDLMPNRDINVIDSNTLSMGQGFMAIAAQEAIAAGKTKEAAMAIAQDAGRRTHLFAALSTLKYLVMGGRAGAISAGMATLFNVKPILTIKDGKLELLERVRTQSRAWSHLIELVAQASTGKPIERMALLHVNALADLQRFRQQISAGVSCPDDTFIAELTPGLSVHAGSGVIGVVFVASA
ncbi:MAG: DegV family protein [Chloroflexi bacterium]|nr:DegV family protein [Chloroflexota bacterium]MCL5273740.1 DegV family protein [Chloroflexota bacterium]